MAGNTENPRIWTLGDVYAADVDAAEPTDTLTELDAAWDALGLLSEDGLTEGREEDVTDHFAWGGILVRTTKSKHKRSFKVVALEDNHIVFGLMNPGSTAVTASGQTVREVFVPTSDNRKAFIFETTDGLAVSRLWVPTGEVVEVGEQVRNEADMVMRELTINVYPDSTGFLYKEWTTDPAAVVPGS